METANKNHTTFLLLSHEEVSKLKSKNYRIRLNKTTRASKEVKVVLGAGQFEQGRAKMGTTVSMC